MDEKPMNENKVSPLAVFSFVLGIVSFVCLFVTYDFAIFLGIVNAVLGLFVLWKKGLKSGINVKLTLSGLFFSIIVFAFLFGYVKGNSDGRDAEINYIRNNIDDFQMSYPPTNTEDY